MEKKLNYLNFLLFFLIATPVFTISSCSKNKSDNNTTSLAPVIKYITPGSGKPGDVIAISGAQFGADKSKVSIRFKTKEATDIVSVTNNEIGVKVPAGFSEDSIPVVVYVSGIASNYKPFYYVDTEAPSITAATPTCFYNSTVVISGKNFSVNKEDNIVKFGDVPATITAATKTSLTVTTPKLGAVSNANITVTKLGMVSNVHSIVVDTDQNEVATYNWVRDTIRPGVVYETGQFTLFGSDRRIHILDVTLNSSNSLGVGFSTNNKSTVAMCNDYGAVAGINAGYFPMSGASDKDPYIRINGTTVQNGHSQVSPIFTNAALTLHNNVATVRKITTGGTNQNSVAAAIPVAEAEDIIVCGPMLIKDGVIENLDMAASHNKSSTARTGLGVTADGKRVFMVVVDYNGGVIGVSTQNLAKILQALGATDAMNFDGGGSSTMFVEGRETNGRVSVNTYSMRSIRSVVYVK